MMRWKLQHFLGVVVMILVASAAGRASGSPTLPFTTKSEKARKLVDDIMIGIENFEAGPALQEMADEIVQADPDFAFGVMLSGLFQPPPQALETFAKAEALAGNASPGERLYIQAMQHTRKGELDQAIEVFEKISQTHPEERRVQMMLGQLHMSKGHMGQAGVYFGRSAALDESTARVHAFIGNIRLMEGDYEGARRLFDRAERLAPGGMSFLTHTGRIFSYLYQDSVEEALKATDRYLESYRASGGNQSFPEVFIWNFKGRIYLENGRPEEAMKAYDAGVKALRESEASIPDDQRQTWEGRYLHGKARALAKMRNFEAAWQQANQIKTMIDQGGESAQQYLPAYHYLAGYIRLEEGKAKEAAEHLEQADPQDPFHQTLKARAYLKLGDEARARRIYQTVADFSQNTMERSLTHNEAVKALETLG